MLGYDVICFVIEEIYGKKALSPSGNDGSTEMSLADIEDAIENYVKAVRVAYEVVFDGV